MTFRILFPSTLEPDQLDRLLARGWFRMRRSMFTTRYLLDGKGLHTAVWARLDLRGYQFRTGLRRHMRRVERDYRVTVAPARPRSDERRLYRRYVAHVGGERPDELADVLGEEPGLLSPFDTWQVSIRDRAGALVGYSLFDVGADSMQSIIGVYDPDHARAGLGFASMLFEIQYGLQCGFRFHYPGYVVEGVSAFDYKRRVGDLEYRDPVGRRWRPLTELDPAHLPDQRMQRGLAGVLDALAPTGIPAELRCYPPFQLVHVHGAEKRCLSQPLFIICGPLRGGRPGSASPSTRTPAPTPSTPGWRPRPVAPARPGTNPDRGAGGRVARASRGARLGVVDSAEAAARQLTRLWKRQQGMRATTATPTSPG